MLLPIGVNVPQWRSAVASQGLFLLMNLAYVVSVFIPAKVFGLFGLHEQSWPQQYLTYGFFHAGILDLLINLYFLWLFAAPMECKIGWQRLLGLFAVATIAGGVAQHFLGDVIGGSSPLVGASAGISGILGAYVLIFPFSFVRCLWLPRLFTDPFHPRMISIYAFFFVPIYFAVLWAANFLRFDFLIVRDALPIAWPAQLTAFATGIAYAALIYGLQAFTQDAERDRAVERSLEAALAGRIQSGSPVKRPQPSSAHLFDPGPLADVPEPLHPLHRLVTQRMSVQARNVYAELLKSDPKTSLSPGVQMELARMLIEIENDDLAIRALDNLLEAYPNDVSAPMTRLELARLLVKLQRDGERAGFLLRSVRATDPPYEVSREIEELLHRLKSGEAAPRPRLFDHFDPNSIDSELPEAVPDSFEDDTPRTRVRRIFGNPEDTDNFLPALPSAVGSAPSARPRPPAPESKDADSGFRVNLDDSDFIRERGIESDPYAERPASPTTLYPPNLPHAIAPEPVDPEGRDLRLDRGPLEIRGISAPPSAPIRGFDDVPQDRTAIQAPIAPDETSPAVYVHALVTTEANRHRSVALRRQAADPAPAPEASPRFSLILAPGAPVDIAIVMAVMGPVIGPSAGLSADGVHHAILRRRGILAHGIEQAEARELAGVLARHGQSACIVAETADLDFGEPLDISTLADEGDTVRIGHEKGAEIRRWDDAVCLGGGWVGPQPGAPCRAAVDLFFVTADHPTAPRRRLRLWENTYVFPNAQRGDRHERFLYIVRLLAGKTRRAIQTRTLNIWLEAGADPEPARFSSPIEYDNFLRWHLLAYCVPSQQFEPHP